MHNLIICFGFKQMDKMSIWDLSYCDFIKHAKSTVAWNIILLLKMHNEKYHFKSHNKNKIAYDTCDIVLVGIVLDVMERQCVNYGHWCCQ